MGDLFEVKIAVYTDGPYSDLIFSERMSLDLHESTAVLRMARLFKALKYAFKSLRDARSRLEAKPPPRNSIEHLFPSPLPEPTFAGEMPSLTFTHRMDRAGETFFLPTRSDQRRSGLYLAKMRKSTAAGPSDAEVEVVVKFTAQYNAEAHRLLATAKVPLAPALHACIPVCDRGPMFMVVMDRVRGEMAWASEQRGELLPRAVYEDVKAALALLHEHDIVFGDLRTPNIMHVAGGDRPRGMLVDFDWAGTDGETRYPATLNSQSEEWCEGVGRNTVMRKAHDLGMLAKFEKLCHGA